MATEGGLRPPRTAQAQVKETLAAKNREEEAGEDQAGGGGASGCNAPAVRMLHSGYDRFRGDNGLQVKRALRIVLCCVSSYTTNQTNSICIMGASYAGNQSGP